MIKEFPLKYKRTRVIGTIEPRWTDETPIEGGMIKDTPLAFIYGAIKKYGNNPKCFDDLRDYIKWIADEIGDPNCQ